MSGYDKLIFERAVPITVASRRPRRTAVLSVCGIRFRPPRACVLGLLGSRPGTSAAVAERLA